MQNAHAFFHFQQASLRQCSTSVVCLAVLQSEGRWFRSRRSRSLLVCGCRAVWLFGGKCSLELDFRSNRPSVAFKSSKRSSRPCANVLHEEQVLVREACACLGSFLRARVGPKIANVFFHSVGCGLIYKCLRRSRRCHAQSGHFAPKISLIRAPQRSQCSSKEKRLIYEGDASKL